MDTIFMNSENSETPKPRILISKLINKLDLGIGKKRLLLYQILACITHGKIKSSYNINKLKISAPTWNDKFELPDG